MRFESRRNIGQLLWAWKQSWKYPAGWTWVKDGQYVHDTSLGWEDDFHFLFWTPNELLWLTFYQRGEQQL